MRLYKSAILLVFLFIAYGAQSQCFSFARSACKSSLGDFVHDGNYNATMLQEGEKAELYKTFFEGQKYRLAICKIKDLPPIHFKITDQNGRVFYNNKDHDFALTWDFQVETTQLLIVEMQVLEQSGPDEDLISGCVAVLFGIETSNKKRK